jgi:hypothetical protein
MCSGGPFLLGAQLSAIDTVMMHSLRALDDKMAADGGGSWLDSSRHPRLCAYAALVKQREARVLAFAEPDVPGSPWTPEMCAKHGIVWLNVPQ